MPRTVTNAWRWGATEQEARAPEEIFTHHIESFEGGDLEGIMLDYADDACLVLPSGILRGKDAIRGFFATALELLPQATFDVSTCFVDDLLFLEWTADSATHSVSQGVDTFIFHNGLIRAQTARFTLHPKA